MMNEPNGEKEQIVGRYLRYLYEQGLPCLLNPEMRGFTTSNRILYYEIIKYLTDRNMISGSRGHFCITDEGRKVIDHFQGRIWLYEEHKFKVGKMELDTERWNCENYIKDLEQKDFAFRWRYITLAISIVTFIELIVKIIYFFL